MISLSLVIILAITGGVYWYFNVYQKPAPEEAPEQSPEELEAKKILEEWLPAVLKPEFLPPQLNPEPGVDIGGGVTRDKNTFGYNWNYLEKNFYVALDYNEEKPGISAYILAVFWDEKIDLDEETALELLENYFNLPRSDLKCETTKTDRGAIKFCRGSWTDKQENWHSIFIVSRQFVVPGQEEGINQTTLMYFLTPLESETYGERPF